MIWGRDAVRVGLAVAVWILAWGAGLQTRQVGDAAARDPALGAPTVTPLQHTNPRAPAPRGGWSTVTLPMDRTAFAELVGLAPDTPRSLLIVQAIRRLHDADARDPEVRTRVVAALRAPSAGTTSVPLPIDPDTWCHDVRTRCAPADLVADLLSDPRAGFAYVGLANLDAPTRALVVSSPPLLQFLSRQRAGTLAAFGDAFRVSNGRVMVPGGTDADSTWRSLLDASTDRPEAFARNLFAGAGGRMAYFYDTVAHLDPARRRFALGKDAASARAMADLFAAIPPSWDIEARPFLRPPLDPSSVLLRLGISDDGRLDGPRARAFWRIALDPERPAADIGGTILAGDDADAAWVVEEVMGADSRRRLARLQALLFAQRRLRSLGGIEASDAVEATRASMQLPALAFSLERAGLAEVPVLASLARRARGVAAIVASADRTVVLAQWQGAVALVVRLSLAGTIPHERALALLSSLAALETAGGRFGNRMARWLQHTLRPAIASAGSFGDSSGGEEPMLLAALAGVPAKGSPHREPRVTWEGATYVLDRSAAEHARLVEVRAKQDTPGLDDALEAFAIAGALDGHGQVAPLRPRIDALAERLPTRGPEDRGSTAVARVLERLSRMLGGAGAPDARALQRERDALTAAAEQLLADVVTAIVYGAALGTPEDRVFLAGDVSARHEFGTDRPGMPPGPSPPWALPAEQAAAGRPWHVQGSLVGLDVTLARLRLRRLLGTMPSHQSLVNAAERSALVLSMMLTPEAIDDTATRSVVEAIARGRTRVRHADEAGRRAICTDAGLCGWRGELVAWARDEEPSAALSSVTRTELAWAGGVAAHPLVDPWGTASAVEGALTVRFPPPLPLETIGGRPTLGHGLSIFADLKLRLAELLVARSLPASLARDVGTAALQDFIDEVQPAYPDDPLAFAREADRLGAERADDYLSALTVPGGPLVPVEGAP